MPYEIIAPASGAVTSAGFGIRADKLPYTMHAAPALAGAEVASLEYQGGDGLWYPLLEAGLEVGISAGGSILAIFSPMQIRVVKSATAAATGIYGSYEDNL